LFLFAAASLDRPAWAGLFGHPQFARALLLSLWTGGASFLLACALALVLVAGLYRSKAFARMQAFTAGALAVPHLAFAVGLLFLVAPSGMLARILVGGETPPDWRIAHDPLGLALIAALALKETPFIFAAAWAVLARGDLALQLAGQRRAALSLGHGEGSVWLRVLLPQLLAQLRWPLAIVWFYGGSVVDMAIVIGPTQPPSLAVIAWTDLNDADPAINGRGFAATALLTAALAATALLTAAAARAWARLQHSRSGPPSLAGIPHLPLRLLLFFLALCYGAIIAALALMSVARRWSYPALFPEMVAFSAWAEIIGRPGALYLSLGLAVLAAATALALALLWFEYLPAARDRMLTMACLLLLALPPLATGAGLYRLSLVTGLSGTLAGLFLAHLSATFAYVFLLLRDPYRGFDRRWRAVAEGLGTRPSRFFARVKLPLLRAPLAWAGAVGFAVSIAQFVPAQLVAAGRHETLPMAAVTLSAGGDRPLLAAHALAMAALTVLGFGAAFLLGRPRWSGR
jgi:putative thiamine transport system permease protein